MNRNDLIIDYERAKEVFYVLENAYEKSSGIFANKNDIIENQCPDKIQAGSEEHLKFLFYICPNDHGLKSSTMYDKAKRLYLLSPNMFDPYWVSSHFSLKENYKLAEIVSKSLGARYPSSLAKSWYLNSLKLINKYNGSVTMMAKSSNDARELVKEIKSFSGYGEKIGTMFLRALIGLGVANDLKNVEDVLAPVDIHDCRIMFLTNIFLVNNTRLKGQDYYKYRSETRLIITDICKKNKLNWLNVDRALWLTGSNGCSKKNVKFVLLNHFV